MSLYGCPLIKGGNGNLRSKWRWWMIGNDHIFRKTNRTKTILYVWFLRYHHYNRSYHHMILLWYTMIWYIIVIYSPPYHYHIRPIFTVLFLIWQESVLLSNYTDVLSIYVEKAATKNTGHDKYAQYSVALAELVRKFSLTLHIFIWYHNVLPQWSWWQYNIYIYIFA